MNSFPLYTLNHFHSILKINFDISDSLSKFTSIKKGLAALETFHKIKLHTPLETAQNHLADRVRPIYNGTQLESTLINTHQNLLLAATPFSIFTFCKLTVSQSKLAFDKALPAFIRVYNLFKAIYFAGIASILSKVVLQKVSAVILSQNSNPTIERISAVASKCLSSVYKIGCGVEIAVLAMEYVQAQEELDEPQSYHSGIYSGCFGMNADKLSKKSISKVDKDNHLRSYSLMKAIQMATTVAKFVATFVFAAAPGAPIVLMGTVLVKIGLDFWWQHKVSLFKQKCGETDADEPRISKISRMVSLVATPFLFVKPTMLAAGLIMSAACAADVYSQSVVAATNRSSNPL